jgi:hypothetical protein
VTALFQATVGNWQIPDAAIGCEPLGRAVRLLLARDLNAELDVQEGKWAGADLQMQERGFDPGVGQVELEKFEAARLYEGPHESLIEAPASAFPNASIMAYQHRPTSVQLFDQLVSYDLTLFVECMVKAGPVADGQLAAFETIVHRRIQRTTEAINNVIQRDATLLGTVLPQQLPPMGGIGRVAWVKPDGKSGSRHLWHGSRLQYTLQRASTTG